MIVEISNEIYTEIKNTLSVTVYKEYPKVEPTYPCVVLGFGSSTLPDTIDSSGETHNSQYIDINIFTQEDGSNQLIIDTRISIDSILADKYKMTRETDNKMENPLDMSIDRWMMRYSYNISKDKKIYRG